ncbi:hypothetical protein [Streptomyces gobiensis]|uniref:hypothetical protein n=1 Tax=Streptomyces gobiensis TaxID=2875706 RepID=UPI001E2F91B5|nr:hypothetical protein [Streptomyces gobiensis]UGY92316.1 hypothetical protein test1122_11625 [Streptomyces gobiensis]
MESPPAVFTGAVCTLFGMALLLWTATRLRRGEPVAAGAHPIAAAVLSVLFGVAFVTTGLGLLLSL